MNDRPSVSFIPLTEDDMPDAMRWAIDQLEAADADMERRHQRRMAQHRQIRRETVALTLINVLIAALVLATVLH